MPRFRLASSAIPCCFVYGFVGSSVPSLVSHQGASPHDASLSSFGSRRARFPAINGTMKALRLPAHASPVAYGFASGVRTLLLVRVRRGAPEVSQACLRPGLFGQPVYPVPAFCLRTQAGSPRFPGDPSRAFALVQDPGRTGKPSPKRVCRCCPRSQHAEGFDVCMISGLVQGFGTCCLRFTSHVAAAHAKLASGWLADLYREGVEPSGSR